MTGKKPEYNAVFISDLHLGAPRVKTTSLLRFLRSSDFDRLYLVGDIVDIWRFHNRRYWSPDARRIMLLLSAIAKSSNEVLYIQGNHDEDLSLLPDPLLDLIPTAREAVYDTIDGRQILITHGDKFDVAMNHTPAKARAGAAWWFSVAQAERAVNRYRRAKQRPSVRFSLGVRKQISSLINYEERFIECALAAVSERGLDGVICGHTHQPALRTIDGLLYGNCGDWVHSSNAIVECRDGKFKLVRARG